MIFKIDNNDIAKITGNYKYIYGYEGYTYIETEDIQSVGKVIEYDNLPSVFFDALLEHKKELKNRLIETVKDINYTMVNVNDKGYIQSELCLYYLSNKTSFRSIIKIFALDKNYDIIEISTDIDELKNSFNKTIENNQEKLSVINSKLKSIDQLRYISQSDSEIKTLLGL